MIRPMTDTFRCLIENKCRTGTIQLDARIPSAVPRRREAEAHEARTGFTKVFRWPVPDGQTPPPTRVEVVGSFNGWRKVPLSYDSPTRTWQVALDNIEGNRTHRYVMLVDGKPSYDKTCDGLIVPKTPDETKWQIATPKGSRVMLMFSQTK